MEPKVSYKREMNHNYLMIEGNQSSGDSYEARMMLANTVEGLLKFRIKQIDTKCYFCYEITSKQPLSRLLEHRSLQVQEIRCIVRGIDKALRGMEEYLLKERQIVLKPEFIYVEPDTFQISLCLLPGEDEGFPERLSRLLEYLLGHVDYQDKDGVIIAYGLYRESLKENYGMDDLLRMLSIESDKEDEPPPRQTIQPKEVRAEMQPVEEKRKVEMPMAVERVSQKRFPVVGLACLPGSLVMLWLLRGAWGLEQYGLALVAGELCVFVLWKLIKGRKPQVPSLKEERSEEKVPWQMVFAEEAVLEPVAMAPTVEEGGDTVLLLDKGEKRAVRSLESMESQTPDISVSYYPFIIGKQESLVDYVFSKDTVSRLHLRLDESDGAYRITDLNSTNGTTVNGSLLEANETVDLIPGDEVNIAEYRFKFR